MENGEYMHVLADISLEIQQGEFVTLIGPSGCGKSVLLQVIAGFITQTHGSIHCVSKRLAMIFQNYALFPWLTVAQNIGFGLTMQGMNVKTKHAIIQEKVHEMGLDAFKDKYPMELSGGMKQRVGIGRALAVNPDILLMDEPFSNLDAFTAEKLRAEVVELWRKYKTTTIMVTHLIDEAVEMSNRIIVLSDRPACVKSVNEVPFTFPRNRRSPEFYKLVDIIREEIE